MNSNASINSELRRPLLGAAALIAIAASAARVAIEPEVQKAWGIAFAAASKAAGPVKLAIIETTVACRVTATTWRQHNNLSHEL